jgi:hypothetical protein
MTIIEKPPISKRALVALNNTNTILIDANITPIYPVRYAYANFFDESIAQAVSPPPISDLLSDSSLSANSGYMLRLLREGWIYIREEVDPEKGHLHIFKYEKIKVKDAVTEKFTKFLFKNKTNAQDGLEVDTSNRDKSYPFVFVRNGIKEVSIVYSEHEFHADVIDKLNSSESERADCMQRVNLEVDSHDYALPASKENLEKLVEDYRKKQNRVLALKDAVLDPELKDITLDLLTTELSVELSPEAIAVELQRKIDYGETAKIVALFDPVGRQKEIANAHAKLTLWEKEYASTQIYPYAIGSIVNDFRKTQDESIQEIVEESINWDAHDEHWGGINDSLNDFTNRQREFADLYTSFMMGDGHTSKPGSLDTYFRKFFCHAPKDDAEAQHELTKLCNVSADIFAGILASVASREAIATIMNDAADKADDSLDGENAFGVLQESVIKIITTPQNGIDWNKDVRLAVDRLMNYLGPVWGEQKAALTYNSKRAGQGSVLYSAKALAYTANKIIPNVLSVYGLKVDSSNTVKLTLDELAEVLAKSINSQVSKGIKITPFDSLDWAKAKQSAGQGLINWAEKTNNLTVPKLLKSISVPVKMGATDLYNHAFFEKSGQALGIFFDINFTGLSIFCNVEVIYSAIYETEMAATDPVTKKQQLLEVSRFTGTLLALTLDGIQVAKGVSAVSNKGSMQLAEHLAPQLASKSHLAGRLLTKTLSNKLMAVLNVVGVTVSVWDTYNSIQNDNIGEAVGHGILAVGSAMLFAQACYGVAAGAGLVAAGSSWTVLGGIIFGVSSLVTLGIGVAVVTIFGKPRFQLLLEGCFWGVSDKHLFDVAKEREILERVKWAQGISVDKAVALAYKNEMQEFHNILFQPLLKIETDHDLSEVSLKGLPTRYTYKFTLPGFEMGVSNLRLEVHRSIKQNSGRITSSSDYLLTQQLQKVMAEVPIDYENGVAKFELYVVFPEQVSLFWHYQPQPDIKIPNRMISEDGEPQRQVLGMIDEESI